MYKQLREIDRFSNDTEFNQTKSEIEALVRSGVLIECGLDPNERTRFVEVYKSNDGETWHLAIPDHAFRGYLKKKSGDN